MNPCNTLVNALLLSNVYTCLQLMFICVFLFIYLFRVSFPPLFSFPLLVFLTSGPYCHTVLAPLFPISGPGKPVWLEFQVIPHSAQGGRLVQHFCHRQRPHKPKIRVVFSTCFSSGSCVAGLWRGSGFPPRALHVIPPGGVRLRAR